jgi:hypothetical protein
MMKGPNMEMLSHGVKFMPVSMLGGKGGGEEVTL